jgi:hypothetical protein
MNACFALGLCGAIMLSGCGSTPDSLANSKIGQKCEVQFRRDALGLASPSPTSPDTGNFNGADVAINGTLKKAQADSILVSTPKADYLIPMRAVLCLKFEPVGDNAAMRIEPQSPTPTK